MSWWVGVLDVTEKADIPQSRLICKFMVRILTMLALLIEKIEIEGPGLKQHGQIRCFNLFLLFRG